jgi:hypothetical protein
VKSESTEGQHPGVVGDEGENLESQTMEETKTDNKMIE